MVTMRDPEAGVAVPANLDLEEKYRARLEEIEERESTVPTARKGSTYLAYKFSLTSRDGERVVDDNGDDYLQWHTCNNSTAYSKAPYLGSREIAEALQGRKLSNEEVRAMLPDWEMELLNRTCIVDLQEIRNEKTGNTNIRIVRLLPDRSKARTAEVQAGTTPAPKRTHSPNPLPGDPAEDDGDGVPF
jgi:hypothetical protein